MSAVPPESDEAPQAAQFAADAAQGAEPAHEGVVLPVATSQGPVRGMHTMEDALDWFGDEIDDPRAMVGSRIFGAWARQFKEQQQEITRVQVENAWLRGGARNHVPAIICTTLAVVVGELALKETHSVALWVIFGGLILVTVWLEVSHLVKRPKADGANSNG